MGDGMQNMFGGAGGGGDPGGGGGVPSDTVGGWNPIDLPAQSGAPPDAVTPTMGGDPTALNIPDAGGGGGGMGNIANLLKLGGAGMGVANMFRTSPTEAALEKGQKLQMKNAGIASKSGQSQLQQYTKGKLSSAQQASVDQFRNQNLAKWRQYLASAGISESSAMADIEANVNMQTAAYAQSLLQTNFENSMKSLGLAGNTLASAATSNLAQEKEISDAQAAAMKAIGEIFGATG
jgi:hypothetical protein